MLFDSHAHLDMLVSTPDALADFLKNEFSKNLTALVQISTDPDIHFNLYSEIVDTGLPVYMACGLTPDFGPDAGKSLEKLNILARDGQVSAIGEIGLDYSRTGSDRAAESRQRELFAAQLGIAARHALPVILHTRAAAADTVALLSDYPGLPGVAHCFTGDQALADYFIDRGWYISFSGILTFASAGDLRRIAATVPAERLLIETDAPFLAPVPLRGQPNRPSFIEHTARVLAGLRGVSFEEIAALTAANGAALFGVWSGKGGTRSV